MKTLFINFSVSFLFVILMPTFFSLQQKAVLNQITKSLKSGNYESLSKHFNNSIEIIILSKEATYSKSQAKVIIKNFFAQNKPNDYIILHQGGPSSSKYVIGNLTTSKGMFRVYYLIKTKDNKQFIHQLRFEKE